MIEYKLLAFSNNEKLSQEVTTLLNNGWKLYGNPTQREGSYSQAVIKETYKNPPAPGHTGGITGGYKKWWSK